MKLSQKEKIYNIVKKYGRLRTEEIMRICFESHNGVGNPDRILRFLQTDGYLKSEKVSEHNTKFWECTGKVFKERDTGSNPVLCHKTSEIGYKNLLNCNKNYNTDNKNRSETGAGTGISEIGMNSSTVEHSPIHTLSNDSHLKQGGTKESDNKQNNNLDNESIDTKIENMGVSEEKAGTPTIFDGEQLVMRMGI